MNRYDKLKKVIQVFTGLVFIFTGLVKLYPIEPFEYKFVETGFFNFIFAPFVARFVIGLEVFIGLFLLLNFYKTFIRNLSFAILGIFSVFIIYIWTVEGGNSDCGCMGGFLQLKPWQSLLKNIVLAIALWLIPAKSLRPNYKAIPAALGILALSIGFILHLPDFDNLSNNYTNKVDFEFRDELLGTFEYNGKPVDFKEGDKMVAFLSVNCLHCEHLAMKLSIIEKDQELPPVYFVFIGEEEKVQDFFEKTKISKPYKMFNEDSFFELAGPSIPVLFYLKDGMVIYKWNKRTLNEAEIREALRNYQQ